MDTFESRKSFLRKIFILGGGASILSGFSRIQDTNNNEQYFIIISSNATRLEKDASKLLQDLCQKKYSISLEITSDSSIKLKNEIIVGNTNRDQSREFNKDGYSIYSKETSYFIKGNGRGLLYAVVQFVKEIIDNNSSSLLSSQRTIKTLPYKVLNINENPCFDYRFIYFSQGFDKDYQLKNRLSTFGVDPETGKVTFENCGSVIHNFLLLFGYDRHFESHPEYYPYINGKRTKVGLQEGDAYRVPCLTNNGVYKIILRELKNRIRKFPSIKIWNLSLPDGISGANDYCNCSNCKSYHERGNGLSETFFPFVNRLAFDLPNSIIRTLAYTVTSKPHTVSTTLSNGKKMTRSQLAQNIEIIFTLPDNDKSKSLEKAKDEKSLFYKNNLSEWKKITNNIFIWEYIVNFNYYLFPFVTLHTIKDNFEFFKKYNVKSIFIQSSSMEDSALAELNSFVYSQLMWDKSMELENLIDVFCKNYYGSASEEMFQYVCLLLKKIKVNNDIVWNPMSGIGSLVYHANPDIKLENHVMFSLKNLKNYKELLNKALKKSEKTIYYKRVLKEYLCILFVEIEASTYYANKAGGRFNQEFYDFVTNNNRFSFEKKFVEFLKICDDLKINYISESLRTPASYIKDVKASMHLK